MEIGMAHVTAIDEEILMSTFLLGSLRFADETTDTTHCSVDLQGHEIL